MSPPNPFAPRRYGELARVTDRVYIFRNITNSAFILGHEGLAVVDTQVNMPTARALLAAIRSVTDKPIRFVVNTHYHWDHTNGNALFKEVGAEIVSSEATRRFMVERAPRQKEFLAGRGFELGEDPFLPEATFEHEKTIDLGGQPLRLFFAGRAETEDATAVHVPRESIVLSGDTVMTGSFPIFGQPVWDEGLEDNAWAETIGRLTALRPAHILPGHGPVAHEKEIELLLRIQHYFLEEVGVRVRRGLSLEAILKEMEPILPDWIRQIAVVWGTPRYAILRVWRGMTRKAGDSESGWQRFKPSAVPASDAVPQEADTLDDYFRMASEAKEGGDAGLRIAILRKALERFPESPEARVVCAEALVEESRREASVLEKGDYFEEARRLWDSVLERDPGHAGALLGKGRYLVMMAYRGGDDPAGGMRLLRRVVETLCACPGIRAGGTSQRDAAQSKIAAEAEFYLGMGYRRLGDEARAVEQFKKALAIDPSFMPARLASY